MSIKAAIIVKAGEVFASGGGGSGGGDIVIPGSGVGEVIRDGAKTFGVVQNVFTVIGVCIVFATLWKVIKAAMLAKPGEAFKFFMGGIVAAVCCFDIAIPLGLIQTFGGVFRTAFDSLSKITGK